MEDLHDRRRLDHSIEEFSEFLLLFVDGGANSHQSLAGGVAYTSRGIDGLIDSLGDRFEIPDPLAQPGKFVQFLWQLGNVFSYVMRGVKCPADKIVLLTCYARAGLNFPDDLGNIGGSGKRRRAELLNGGNGLIGLLEPHLDEFSTIAGTEFVDEFSTEACQGIACEDRFDLVKFEFFEGMLFHVRQGLFDSAGAVVGVSAAIVITGDLAGLTPRPLAST